MSKKKKKALLERVRDEPVGLSPSQERALSKEAAVSQEAAALPEMTNNVRDSGDLFVFGLANSGERVDEKSAMQIATVYACVRLLAESVASLPLHLYRITEGKGGRPSAIQDSLPAAESGDDFLFLPGGHAHSSPAVGECLCSDRPGRAGDCHGTVSSSA